MKVSGKSQMTRRHVIKQSHENGVPLNPAKSWCGFGVWHDQWCFTDAQHALLAIENGALQQPCLECIKAIRKTTVDYLSFEAEFINERGR